MAPISLYTLVAILIWNIPIKNNKYFFGDVTVQKKAGTFAYREIWWFLDTCLINF